MNEMFDISVPIETDNGKTIWHRIGTYFKNDDPNKKYEGTIQLNSIPLGAVAPLKLFIYKRKEYRRRNRENNQGDYGPPPMGDDDIPFG